MTDPGAPGSQPYPHGDPYSQPTPPLPPAGPGGPQPGRSGHRRALVIAAAVVGVLVVLGVGIAIGLSSGGGDPKSAAASPAPTTAPAYTPSFDPSDPDGDGIQDTTPPPPDVSANYTPVASDFALAIKVTRKECFGSAGCNVDFTVDFAKIGPRVPEDGSFTVTFDVRGGEDPLTDTIEVTDGNYSPLEESIGTASSSSKLSVHITDVASSS
jgi:hypothetical protein